MKNYDKASWHIDGGEESDVVVERFKKIFEFLRDKDMLSDEGKESLDYCMDSSISLNSNMVNASGEGFLDKYYDTIIQKPNKMDDVLKEAYEKYEMEK